MLFVSARNLAEAYFGEDFDHGILEDPALWQGITKHRVAAAITLPMTNTLAARQMRVAAFLAILASEFTPLLLEPTYLPKQTEHMRELLSDLARRDHEKESYLRSVLLTSVSAQGQELVIFHRTRNVRDTVLKIVQPLFQDDDDRKALGEALDNFCEETGRLWSQIQKLKEKVDVCDEFACGDYADWKPLSFQSKRLLASQPPATKAEQNGNHPGGGSGGGRKNKQQDTQGQANSRAPQPDATRTLSKTVVWPAFIAAIQSEDERLLTHGYVLEQAHLDAALEEEMERTRSGQARNARSSARRKRTMSIGGNQAASSGEVNTNAQTSSGSFLSMQGGGGLKKG